MSALAAASAFAEAPATGLSRRERGAVLLIGTMTAAGVAAVIGFALGSAIEPTHVSLGALQSLAAAFYVLCPVVIAHGVLTTLADRAAARSTSKARSLTRNPWTIGLGCALCLGVPFALLSRPIAAAWCPAGASPAAVALLLACGAAPLAAAVIGLVTSAAFTRAVRLPQRQPGSATAYLLTRHVAPVGLFNAAVNLAAAFALFPGPLGAGVTRIPVDLVVSDAAVTFALIALFVGSGTVTHARGDRRSGAAAPLRLVSAPSVPRGVALLATLTLACVGGAWLALSGGAAEGLSLPAFALWRALGFGGFAALVAFLTARWTLALQATK